MSTVTSYTVRLLSAEGCYPRKPLVIEDFAVLVAEDNLVWSAVSSPRLADEPVGEISWLSPDEVRFYSAISLALRDPPPRFRINTRSVGREISLRGNTVSRDSLIEVAREAAEAIRQDSPEERLLGPQGQRTPRLLDMDPEEEVLDLLYSMDPANPLLIRGLYKLVMTDELIRFPQFLEEATLASFISREAALELLRRKLESEGNDPATRDEVFQEIRVKFPTGRSLVEVLETDWEARVLMVHPANRFGEYWSPPVFAQECFDAHHALVHLYRFLLLGDVWEPS